MEYFIVTFAAGDNDYSKRYARQSFLERHDISSGGRHAQLRRKVAGMDREYPLARRSPLPGLRLFQCTVQHQAQDDDPSLPGLAPISPCSRQGREQSWKVPKCLIAPEPSVCIFIPRISRKFRLCAFIVSWASRGNPLGSCNIVFGKPQSLASPCFPARWRSMRFMRTGKRPASIPARNCGPIMIQSGKPLWLVPWTGKRVK